MAGVLCSFRTKINSEYTSIAEEKINDYFGIKTDKMMQIFLGSFNDYYPMPELGHSI